MRATVLVAVLSVAVAGACGGTEVQPDETPGTGGRSTRPDGGPIQFGTGGSGVGGAMACDYACQAAALWDQYVAAVTAVQAAEADYRQAIANAMPAARTECGCISDQCSAQGACLSMAGLTVEQAAAQMPGPVAAAAVVTSATMQREGLYQQYNQAARFAGLTPMAKL